MTTIPIRIILHGLIALVPQNGPDGAKMTALLVDAHSAPAGMTCFSEHRPVIKFPASTQDCTAFDECGLDSPGICACKLNRREISILPQSQRPPVVLGKKPLRSLPFDREAAVDFAYVANLSQLDYTVDSDVLPKNPPSAPPSILAARFVFPFYAASACGLSTRHDDGADYVHPMNLRRLETEETSGELSQAMAQSVEAITSVDLDGSTGQIFKLRLSPFAGESGNTLEFNLPTNLPEVQIDLSNDRSHFMMPDQVCDDGIGRDFAFFYELVEAQKKPSWAARPVPHVKYSLAKSSADLYPPSDPRLCKGMKGPMSRPICPMATFNPE